MDAIVPWDENISNFRFVGFTTDSPDSPDSPDSTNATAKFIEIEAVAFDEEFEQRRFKAAAAAPDALTEFFEFLGWAGRPRLLLAHNAGLAIGTLNTQWKRLRREAGPGTRRDTHGASGALPEVASDIVIDTRMLSNSLLPDVAQLENIDVHVLHSSFLHLLGLAADRCSTVGANGGLTLGALIDLAGGYFVLDPSSAARRKPFRLPPRIAAIEPLCGTDARLAITYESGESDADCRYITPLSIKVRGFRVYIEAFCHRDNVKKTFRADRIHRILRLGHQSDQTAMGSDQPC